MDSKDANHPYDFYFRLLSRFANQTALASTTDDVLESYGLGRQHITLKGVTAQNIDRWAAWQKGGPKGEKHFSNLLGRILSSCFVDLSGQMAHNAYACNLFDQWAKFAWPSNVEDVFIHARKTQVCAHGVQVSTIVSYGIDLSNPRREHAAEFFEPRENVTITVDKVVYKSDD